MLGFSLRLSARTYASPDSAGFCSSHRAEFCPSNSPVRAGWDPSRYPEPLSGKIPSQAAGISHFLTGNFISESYCAEDDIQSSEDHPALLLEVIEGILQSTNLCLC